jgi:hypothetical protein
LETLPAAVAPTPLLGTPRPDTLILSGPLFSSQFREASPSEDDCMARRILNRRDLRAANDAAERREAETEDEDEKDEEEEEDEKEEDEEGESDGDAEDEGDADAEAEGGDDDEEAPKKKKKPKKPPKEKVVKPRKSRSAKKPTRMKVVWGVFNNSNARVATYDYPKRADADAHAAKLTADKKSTHFVQPVKEPMEEKKEDK